MITNAKLKQILRTEMRRKRNALSATEQKVAAEAVLAILKHLPEFIQAKTLSGYLAFDGEIDLSPTFKAAQDKACYIPLVNQNPGIKKLLFIPLLQNNCPTSHREIKDLDLVLVPIVAFDRAGNRLGMGGGYFDATIKELKHLSTRPRLIGIAHTVQEVAEVPTEPWDMPLDGIVTNNFFINI